MVAVNGHDSDDGGVSDGRGDGGVSDCGGSGGMVAEALRVEMVVVELCWWHGGGKS